MILYFNGDSFTYGAELWEEANIPGYATLTNRKDAEALQKVDNKDVNAKCRDLSYTGWFKEQYPTERIINDGASGSSQIHTVYRSIAALTKLRKENPDEKIVCILQDTSPDRVWMYVPPWKWYSSYVIPSMDQYHPMGTKEGLRTQEFFLDYYPPERLLYEHFLVTAALKHACTKLNIEFFHWRIWQSHIDATKIDQLDFDFLLDDFFDPSNTYNYDMVSSLQSVANDNNEKIELPGGHFKLKYQPILAKLLHDVLIDKKIL